MSDYIERDAAIKEIENADYSLIADDAESLKADYLGEIIENIPAADVAPVAHGRWVNAGDWALAKCDVCGECYDVSDEATEEHFKLFREFYRYCPNCGAKMDGRDTNVPTTKEDGNDLY